MRGTVQHNIEVGLRLRGVAATERAARAREWMERLRISDLADRPVGALSGGRDWSWEGLRRNPRYQDEARGWSASKQVGNLL